MGKKLVDKMAALKVKFIEGCQKNGYGPLPIIEQIWADWAEFAKYAFNKSHATCYSWIAYQTAYLKAHFPAEFMAANLTRNKDDITEVGKFMDECKNLGMSVMGPDVNESDLNFTVNKDGNIRFGLGGVKGVGEGAVLAIIDERNKNGRFMSVFDFIERVNLTTCNKRTIESLALCGAFDSFSDIRREQFFIENSKSEIVLDTIIRYGNKFQNDQAMNQNSLFGDSNAIEITKPEIPYAPEWSPLEKLNKERDLIGMYLSAHPLDEFELEINHVCNTTTSDLKDLAPLEGKPLRIGGMVTNFRHAVSKAGNPYGVFMLEDYVGAFEFALFGNNYVEFNKYMIKDMYLYISAIVQEKGADYKFKKPTDPDKPREIEFKIQKIELFKEIKDKLVEKLTVTIPLQQIDTDLVIELSELVLKNKGSVNLYIEIVDENSPNKVKLFSRQNRLKINTDVYHKLKKAKDEGRIVFQVN
jgi:DNA polymerase-3 subunit alpha